MFFNSEAESMNIYILYIYIKYILFALKQANCANSGLPILAALALINLLKQLVKKLFHPLEEAKFRIKCFDSLATHQRKRIILTNLLSN